MAGSAQDVTFGLGYTIASQLQSRTNTNAIYEWNTVPTNSTFVPDALNRYSSVAGTTFGYDGRGNLQSDGTRTLTYDIENRLVSVVGGAGLSLTYDPLGRLWQTTSGTSITQFLYDGNRLVEEISNSGTVLRRYAHGPGTDNPVVWYEGAVLTDRRWLHTDERGSVIASTDGTGAATVYTYGPYGEPTSWSGSRFRYTGQIMLPEAQLYHYKARVYDPILGRFLQTDPIGATDDLNLYTYTGNDPLDRTDPTGLYTCSDSDKGADCAVVSKAIGTIKDAASKLPKDSDGQKALNKVLKFYGNDGEKNGVSVAFSGNGTANETMKGASITITFNLEGLRSEFSGRGDGSKLNVEMGATAAHEGQHGLDDQARGRSPHGDQEFVQTERNAFRTQSYVNEGERVPSAYGVWLPGISNEQRTRAINLNGDRGAENDCGPSPCP